MPARPWKPCSTAGCPELTPPGQGKCGDCQIEADRRRGTATQRGYGTRHRNRFRRGVLRRNPLCVCDHPDCRHGQPCGHIATVADHWPHDRRHLLTLGLDPDDPANGRGLCKPCHDRHTASTTAWSGHHG